MTDALSRPVVVVGAGRAGTGVGLALAEAGLDVAFITRRPVPVIGKVPAFRIDDARAPAGDVTMLVAVPDGRIAQVARDLRARGRITDETVAGHLSGALPSAVLDAAGPLAGRFSAHPLFSFPPPAPLRPLPPGTAVMVEGDLPGAAAGLALFRRAGAATAPIAADRKALCHAAAVMDSNLPAVLLWACAGLFRECGVPDPVAAAARLMGSFASNLAASPGASTITGPFARGDDGTLRANLEALDLRDPELARLYRDFGGRLADLLREHRILSERTWLTTRETLK